MSKFNSAGLTRLVSWVAKRRKAQNCSQNAVGAEFGIESGRFSRLLNAKVAFSLREAAAVERVTKKHIKATSLEHSGAE